MNLYQALRELDNMRKRGAGRVREMVTDPAGFANQTAYNMRDMQKGREAVAPLNERLTSR